MAIKRDFSWSLIDIDTFDNPDRSVMTVKATTKTYERSGLWGYLTDKWDLVSTNSITERFIRNRDGKWYLITRNALESPPWFWHYETSSNPYLSHDPERSSCLYSSKSLEREWQRQSAIHSLQGQGWSFYAPGSTTSCP